MMNINEFLTEFTETNRETQYAKRYDEVGQSALLNLPDLRELFDEFSGATFDEGLFKIHNQGSFYFWTNLTFDYFKEFKGNSYCFGFDWLGRQYAINYFNNEKKILILDPATAEAFEVEKSIELFLNEDLVENKDYLFDIENYSYLKNSYNQLKFEECWGFKQFLFLGGKDEIDNYEITDMEVYWELNYQIYCKTKNLPPGTSINLSIE